MKEVEKCVSKGISEKISPFIYNELFELAKAYQEDSELQTFSLSKASNGTQIIQHSRDGKRKAEVHLMMASETVLEKVILLKVDNSLNMLLDKESQTILKRHSKCRVLQ